MVHLFPDDRSMLKTGVHWRQMCTGPRCALEAAVHGDRCALAAGVLETGLHCMQVCTEVGVYMYWSQVCTRGRGLPVAGVHWRQVYTGGKCAEKAGVQWWHVCPGGRCILETGVA